MKIALAAFTACGAALAQQIAEGLTEQGDTCVISAPERIAGRAGLSAMLSLDHWTTVNFPCSDALVFVGAAGIAVRAAAPHLKDKFTDPAVISLDESGEFVIPLVSGHVGGANALARKIAGIVGGEAVISTATDVNSLFAVDEWARSNGLVLADRALAKEISAAILDGHPISFQSDFPINGVLPPEVACEHGNLGFCVTIREGFKPFERTLRFIPRILTLGIGCRRDTDCGAIEQAVNAVLSTAGLSNNAVAAVATVDLKKDEAGLLEFCAQHKLPLNAYTVEELRKVLGEFTPSAFVAEITGVDNVCERAAVMSRGTLINKKQAFHGVTVALAQLPFTVFF